MDGDGRQQAACQHQPGGEQECYHCQQWFNFSLAHASFLPAAAGFQVTIHRLEEDPASASQYQPIDANSRSWCNRHCRRAGSSPGAAQPPRPPCRRSHQAAHIDTSQSARPQTRLVIPGSMISVLVPAFWIHSVRRLDKPSQTLGKQCPGSQQRSNIQAGCGR